MLYLTAGQTTVQLQMDSANNRSRVSKEISLFVHHTGTHSGDASPVLQPAQIHHAMTFDHVTNSSQWTGDMKKARADIS